MKLAKRLIAAVLAMAVASPCAAVFVSAAPTQITDIKGHWAEKEIQALFDLIVITGSGDKFYPNKDISRAEFSTLTGRAFYGGQSGKTDVYSDVATDSWYFKYVSLLTEKGVLSGVGDGIFAPNATLTRQDAAALMTRIIKNTGKNIFAKREMAEFADSADIADYAREGVEFLYTAGIISGYEDGTFRPEAYITKAEASVIIYKVFYFQDDGLVRDPKPDVAEVWEHEISSEPLDIYMTAFNKVEENAVDTRSEYLTLKRKDIPEIFGGTVVFATGSKNVWINDGKYEAVAPAVYSDDERYLAPAETLAALAGGVAEVSGDTVKIGNLTAKVGDKKITVDGVAYDTAVEVRELNGTIYLPIREFAVYKLKKYYSESVLGLALIADRQIDLTYDKFEPTAAGMMAELYLDRPSKDNIAADFEKASGKGVHPRIFGSNDRLNEFFELAKTDATAKSLLDRYIAYADKLLGKTLKKTGHSDKANSFEVVEALYVAYVYTGDTKYAAKAEELALAVVDSEDWGQENYWLDVSFWLLICAETYDFFYDYLSQDTKDLIATQMIKLGLTSGYEHYHRSFSDWPLRDNNWNTVCNGGLDIAAAVLYGEGYADDMCLDIIQNSFESLSYALYNYAPHGGLGESTHYWEYGTEYVVRVIDAYQNIFGDDYGLIDYPGVLEAPYFAYYIKANSGAWAFHDDPPGYEYGSANTTFSNWAAYRTGDLNLQRLRHEVLGDSGTPSFYDLYYYMQDDNPDEKGVLDIDKVYEHLEVAFSRNDESDSEFWLGIHGHKNNVPHIQWDMGNFVYEAFGVRFATDYGRDSYDLPESGGEADGGSKGKLFVARPEGHNLYVINPDAYQGQQYDAQTRVEQLISKPKGAAYKVDLTEAYWGDVTSAERGYMLTNDRTSLVVQDEISLNDDKVGSTIKWFWQTRADAFVNDDKSVTLIRDGFTVTLYFDSNVSYDVAVRDAGPMETSPTVKGQMAYVDNESKLVEVTINADVKDVVFRCTAEPIGHEMSRGKLVPIDEWTIPDGEINTDYAYADMIYLDGEPLADFDPETYAYTVNGAFITKGYPTVTAKSEGTVSVVTNPNKPDVASVVVKSKTGAVKVYALTFLDQTALGAPASGTKLKITAVEAMDSDNNLPEWAIDGDVDTRWSAATTAPYTAWIKLDFGEVKEFDALVLCVGMGDHRKNSFDIEISDDGENWTVLREGIQSVGTPKSYETLELPTTKARFVRLQCHGADTSVYNSYSEIQFWKLK